MSDGELRAANQWIVGGDTGVSSTTIWSVMMGVTKRGGCGVGVPVDAGDFGRCYRLLKLIPSWRGRLHEVAKKYPEWTGLVREWSTLEAMYEKVGDLGIYRENDNWDREASSRMYEFMQPLINEGRIAAGWKQGGPGSWSRGNQHEVTL